MKLVRGSSLLVVGLLAACQSTASPSPSGSSSPKPNLTPGPTATPVETPDMSAYAGWWQDATADTIGTTAEYTNRVEVADLNGDGQPDILFANGGDYEGPSPDGPVASRVFLNQGPGHPFVEVPQVLGGLTGFARVIKVRDLNQDGHADIVIGNTWQTQSQLLLGTGSGFTNATAQLPQQPLSVGDLEIGDVDADGDLDIVLADWGGSANGTLSPFETGGGLAHLWLNDGSTHFTDATAAQMPGFTKVGFSWDLELVDVDNDWDLDLAISAKASDTSYLFENDGTGHFSDVTGSLPHFGNNYEFEPMDLDGDGFLDLVTINDGSNLTGRGGQEHVFANNGDGTFRDATAEWWPDWANPSEDDNAEIFLDVDSDGDADFLLFSLSGPDRLLVNDGTGHLAMVTNAIDAPASLGSLGLAVADLNSDRRWDIVESQGEATNSFDERVYLATDKMPQDTADPHVWTDLKAGATGTVTVHARVTDGLSPYIGDDPGLVWVRGAGQVYQLTWYGEYLFRGEVSIPAGSTNLQVCAEDRYGNDACVDAP